MEQLPVTTDAFKAEVIAALDVTLNDAVDKLVRKLNKSLDDNRGSIAELVAKTRADLLKKISTKQAYSPDHLPAAVELYHISRRLVNQQVFFSLGQLRSELHHELELRGVTSKATRSEWIRRHISQIWLVQHKERSKIFQRLQARYEIAFADFAEGDVYAPSFKFRRQKERWAMVTEKLSHAWRVYARVTIRYCLENIANRLPTRSEELYQAWRQRIRPSDAIDIDDLPLERRPSLPPHFLPPRTRLGKRPRDREDDNPQEHEENAEMHSDEQVSPSPSQQPHRNPSSDEASVGAAAASDTQPLDAAEEQSSE